MTHPHQPDEGEVLITFKTKEKQVTKVFSIKDFEKGVEVMKAFIAKYTK